MNIKKAVIAVLTVPLYKEFWIFSALGLAFFWILGLVLNSLGIHFELYRGEWLTIVASVCVVRAQDTYNTPD
ncbi:MAG: hypothetical protein FJ161_01425 [Gammaproteobacteria bacterium]|nr:hypothetical protein [Gammaproteobacteria bacterium]